MYYTVFFLPCQWLDLILYDKCRITDEIQLFGLIAVEFYDGACESLIGAVPGHIGVAVIVFGGEAVEVDEEFIDGFFFEFCEGVDIIFFAGLGEIGIAEQGAEVFEAEAIDGEEDLLEFFFGEEHFGDGFVIADHIDLDVVADDAGVVGVEEEFGHLFGFFWVGGNFEAAFEGREAGDVLEGEGEFVLSCMHHLGVVEAKTAFVDHTSLEVFHDGLVEVLIDEAFFKDGADFAKRAVVAADEFLVDEHISDVIIHKVTAF